MDHPELQKAESELRIIEVKALTWREKVRDAFLDWSATIAVLAGISICIYELAKLLVTSGF